MPIPSADLAQITVPTTSLIWGRQDRLNRLRIAEEASAQSRMAAGRGL